MVFEITGEFFQALAAQPGWFGLFEDSEGVISKVPIAFWVITQTSRPSQHRASPGGKTLIRPVGPVGEEMVLLETLANGRGIIGPGLGESVPLEDYPKYGILVEEPKARAPRKSKPRATPEPAEDTLEDEEG